MQKDRYFVFNTLVLSYTVQKEDDQILGLPLYCAVAKHKWTVCDCFPNMLWKMARDKNSIQKGDRYLDFLCIVKLSITK